MSMLTSSSGGLEIPFDTEILYTNGRLSCDMGIVAADHKNNINGLVDRG